MKSQLADAFITYFRALPDEVRMQARKNYRLWKGNLSHPSLHFKRVHAHEPLYSAQAHPVTRRLRRTIRSSGHL